MDNNESNVLEPAPNPLEQPKTRTPRKPKPLVEGINSPVIKETLVSQAEAPLKPQLTDAEKKLVTESPQIQIKEIKTEPKKPEAVLMPKTVLKKEASGSSSVLKVFFTIVFLVCFGLLGYIVYNWYISRPSGVDVTNNVNIDQQVLPTPTPEITPTQAPVVTPTPTPTIVQPTIKVNSTPTGYLNVRSKASTSSELITKINPGEVYVFTTKQNGWYSIQLTDGRVGWVSGQYVTEQK